ncbi:MAG: NAD-glutamate dehydrogenase, partial [Candidatus Berkiella sp.]
MRRQEEAREELTSRVINLVNEKLPKDDAKLLTNFVKQYYLSAAPEDLLELEVIDLYGALVSHWHFIHQRAPGEAKVRVYNPQYEQHGWQSTHTVIEVIDDHLPFLIESVRMVLHKRGLNVHLILHLNGLRVQRDAKGIITNIYNNHYKDTKLLSETPMFIEIDKQSDPAVLDEIEADIRGVIEDVTLTVNDWHELTGKMESIIQEMKVKSKDSKKELDKEILEFLEWINNNHFTYLGYCQRKLIADKGNYHFTLDNDTCLGILRKNPESYFGSFQDMPKIAQESALSSFPLILGKTDKISTVHRPTHTDFIVVKIFDEKKKVIGEHQFIGLYTSAAYNRSPQGIPLLRLRVKQILERAGVSHDSHDGKALSNILETLPRDDFFHATVDELYDLSMGILHLQERQRIRLFIRKDSFTRIYSCLVFVPRERFNSKLREKMETILKQELGGYQVDFSTRFTESVLARIHFIVRYKDDLTKEYDPIVLQDKLIQVARTWEDNFKDSLLEHFGEENGNRLFQLYRGAFPV